MPLAEVEWSGDEWMYIYSGGVDRVSCLGYTLFQIANPSITGRHENFEGERASDTIYCYIGYIARCSRISSGILSY